LAKIIEGVETKMTLQQTINETFKKGNGILRMIPNFVPRKLAKPGCRLRLHPDDYFILGVNRGAIKERWFSSIVPAMNGELAPSDEGMSYVAVNDRIEDKVLFKHFIDELGSGIIGEDLIEKYGTWPMYAKFFDYETPLFHHLHLDDSAARRVGQLGKPEAYYFPPQLNNHPGLFPVTYFGVDPDITKEQVRERLLQFEKSDGRITELSRAYRLELGTGWYTPPGVLHAPGSLLTYEPQWNSDVSSMFENMTAGEFCTRDALVVDCPEDKKDDIDYVISLMDWEKNIDPNYRKHYFRPPIHCPHSDEKHVEKWITYGNPYVGAKELTIMPGQTVTVKDSAAYGCIIIQGYGKFGVYQAEAAILLRFGQLSADEFFVGDETARQGVVITNNSCCEPMVILKHFGPNHPDMPQ